MSSVSIGYAYTLAILRRVRGREQKSAAIQAIDYEIFKKQSFVINLFPSPNLQRQMPSIFEMPGIFALFNPSRAGIVGDGKSYLVVSNLWVCDDHHFLRFVLIYIEEYPKN
jgi:hypothetical protein